MWFLCVFWLLLQKKNSLFYTESIDYDTVKYFQVCSWGKKRLVIKRTKSLIDVCAMHGKLHYS